MNGLRCMFTFLLAGALFARADDKTVTLPELMQDAQQWAQDNLDTNVLNALPKVDDPVVQQFFREVQQRFQGDYVVDLAGLGKPRTPCCRGWKAARKPSLTPPGSRRRWIISMSPTKSASRFRRQKLKPISRHRRGPIRRRKRNAAIWVREISGRPWSAAAKEYVPELKPIFAAQKIPPALVWVADVESSFDRRAESPMGAAGLFQLMPATAKRFGLSLWPRDQRFQTEPSAIAAAQYLKYLFERFQDWRLALAAYNAGEGAVQKLLDHYKTRSYDDIAGHLPAETQMYVPRVEAILLQREGAQLEELPAPQT